MLSSDLVDSLLEVVEDCRIGGFRSVRRVPLSYVLSPSFFDRYLLEAAVEASRVKICCDWRSAE